MKCPECGCKFKEKFQIWVDDSIVICPVCKHKIGVNVKEDKKGETCPDCGHPDRHDAKCPCEHSFRK